MDENYKSKQIDDFPSATDITDDDVLLAEQAGKTRKLSGKVLKDFCRAAISVFTTRAETAATEAEAAKDAAAEIEQLISEKAGVASFNGRNGLVVPESGDYTAAMVGAAAAEYAPLYNGLSYNADGITKSGFYTCQNGVPTNNWGTVLHFAYGENRSTQYFFSAYEYSSVVDILRNTVFKRDKLGGTWGEWEYVNPPMTLDVEYRTTERYKGKPVYAKLIDFGQMPNNTYKVVTNSIGVGVDAIVDFRAEMHTSTSTVGLPFNELYARVTECSAGKGTGNLKIEIRTTADYSAYTANVLVKYTKI